MFGIKQTTVEPAQNILDTFFISVYKLSDVNIYSMRINYSLLHCQWNIDLAINWNN